MTTITLSPQYGYVAGALLSTFYLNFFQIVKVSAARKEAGITYPQLYAEKAEVAASKAALVYNCAQRAHANTIENMPTVLISTLISASKYPTYAATALAVWSVFRVFYTIGYCTGDPKKRNYMFGSLISSLAGYGLLFLATATAVQLALA